MTSGIPKTGIPVSKDRIRFSTKPDTKGFQNPRRPLGPFALASAQNPGPSKKNMIKKQSTNPLWISTAKE